MGKQQFVNCKWRNKELLFTAGSFFVLMSQATWLDQGYISITSSLHVLYNMGYRSLIFIIYGYSYHLIAFQGINLFSCFQICISLTSFTVNNSRRRAENCWEGKSVARLLQNESFYQTAKLCKIDPKRERGFSFKRYLTICINDWRNVVFHSSAKLEIDTIKRWTAVKLEGLFWAAVKLEGLFKYM